MGLIVSDFCLFLEYFSFFYVIFRIDFREKSKMKTVGITVCLLVWFAVQFLGITWDGIIAGPVHRYLFLIYFAQYFMFDVSIMKMAVLEIGQWLILCMYEITMHVILGHFCMNDDTLEIVIMLLAICCLWIFYFTIGKKINPQIFILPIRIWCLLDVILLILTAMMSFFIYVIMNELPNNEAVLIGKTLSVTGGIVICILIFVMMYYYKATYHFRIEKELAEMQNMQQREYFLRLLEKEEETRNFRHEIINDLLEMQNYCEKGNYEQMKSYLESTLGTIRKISRNSYDVGNNILNTVLNYYLQPIKEKYHIEVSGYVDENISIYQRDLCILAANLIKNALEAVSKLDGGAIKFHVEQGKEYLYIQTENAFDGKLEFNKEGIPKTSKEDKRNHGIGIYNIKQVVKKYDGTYHAEVINMAYHVEIYLKL